MKQILIFCCACLLFACPAFANEIDKLQTNEDVNNFLIRRISKKFKEQPLLDKSSSPAPEGLAARHTFYKVDVDDNGRTDLVVYGTQLLVIIDKAENDYQVRYLDRGPYMPRNLALVGLDINSKPCKIIVQKFGRPKEQYDTLVYLFNSFVEYNPNPASDFNFDQIEIKTNRCFGECPVFQMTINKDRSAVYRAIMYNQEQYGEYTGYLPKNELADLIALLKYLPLDKLKNDYAVDWTDDQTAVTTIRYNGQTKTIRDYGQVGTYGLGMLYLKFLRWRTSVDWSQ